MFGWRRRSEGFEWQEYVRTTVLVRRADRQRRVEEARIAALAKVQNGREQAEEALRLRAEAAQIAVKHSAAAAGQASAQALASLWRAGAGAAAAGAANVRQAAAKVPKPHLNLEAKVGGVRDHVMARGAKATGTLLALWDMWPFRLKHLASAAGILAMVLVVGPMLSGGDATPAARVTKLTVEPISGTGLAATGGLSGRAAAVSGDLLRVGSTLVRLEGVEAPEAAQTCRKVNGKRGSCAAAARSALERLVRGQSVTCAEAGRDEAGRVLASCQLRSGGDVGAAMVRNGYVFAASGLGARYGAEEQAAQESRTGLWQSEGVMRPQAWRDQAWSEAQKAAPDGCPIKGVVRAAARVYQMPWSADYAAARVKLGAGDRWFCTEDDAKAAGFQQASRL